MRSKSRLHRLHRRCLRPEFIRPNLKSRQCVGSERVAQRSIDRVTASSQQNTPDPRFVVTWIEGTQVPPR